MFPYKDPTQKVQEMKMVMRTLNKNSMKLIQCKNGCEFLLFLLDYEIYFKYHNTVAVGGTLTPPYSTVQ